MSKVILELNSKQVESLVENLPLKDKIQLAQRLNLETWQARFKYLLTKIDKRLEHRSILCNEEIIKIVKKVRGHNYAQGHH